MSDRFLARVMRVYPPRPVSSLASSSRAPRARTPPPEERPCHVVTGDLKIPIKEAKHDDPLTYLYQVQIIEEESGKGNADSRSDKKLSAKEREAREQNRQKWSGSLMEVKCNVLRYHRLPVREILAHSLSRQPRSPRFLQVDPPSVYSGLRRP